MTEPNLKTNEEIEKRLLLVSGVLEAATSSLETLVVQMREALASTASIKEVANAALELNEANKQQKKDAAP